MADTCRRKGILVFWSSEVGFSWHVPRAKRSDRLYCVVQIWFRGRHRNREPWTRGLVFRVICEPSSADFLSGAARCEPRSVDFCGTCSNAALCQPRSANMRSALPYVLCSVIVCSHMYALTCLLSCVLSCVCALQSSFVHPCLVSTEYCLGVLAGIIVKTPHILCHELHQYGIEVAVLRPWTARQVHVARRGTTWHEAPGLTHSVNGVWCLERPRRTVRNSICQARPAGAKNIDFHRLDLLS